MFLDSDSDSVGRRKKDVIELSVIQGDYSRALVGFSPNVPYNILEVEFVETRLLCVVQSL